MIFNRNIRTDSSLASIIIYIFIIFIGFFRLAYPYLDHWDNFDDAANLISAKNFVKFGFLRCYFLSLRTPQIERPTGFYTHYPPLSEIFHGFILKMTNINHVELFRIIALLFSALACWFWFLFLRNSTLSSLIALGGLLFYITNPIFILNADAVNLYGYMEFFRTLILLLFIIFLEKKNKFVFLLLLLSLSLNIFNSYEYVIYIFLFMLLYSFFFGKKLGSGYWLAIFMAAGIGFMLHFSQNALMYGSSKQAFFDLFNRAIQRINSSAELSYMAPTFKLWLYGCFIRNIKLVLFSAIKLIVLIIFLFIFSKKKKASEETTSIINGLKLLILLFVCGLSWWILFPSYNIIHIYPATHMLLAVSLLDALIFYFLIYFNREGLFKINKVMFNITVSIWVLLSVWSNLWKSDLPITQRNIKYKELFLNYTKILYQIGSDLEKDEYIFSNYWNTQVMEYYSDRNCLCITTPEELKKQTSKHKYFLYFAGSEELFYYLSNNYGFIGEYVAQNIPSNTMMRFIIFKKVT